MRRPRFLLAYLALVLPAFFACSNSTGVQTDRQERVGTVRAGLSLGELAHDVSAVRFEVVAAGADCGAQSIASTTSAVEEEELPASVAGNAGAHRPFADAFFVLPPGDYRVCATPLAGDAPSSECGTAEMIVSVAAEQSNEVLLLSQCKAGGNSGLDVVVALNDPPQITAVALDPSKFITACEALTLTVSAEDPNGDAVSYAFAIAAGPSGAELQADGAKAVFSGPAGDYELAITATDAHGNPSSLTLPVHVSQATCAAPDDVQAIFAAQCAPCHTTSASGGLRLADAATSYANLVGVPSSAMACAARVRVVPGAPADSYLIAKLRGEAGICGAQMPRGRPPLPEAEIQAIESWIASLPH